MKMVCTFTMLRAASSSVISIALAYALVTPCSAQNLLKENSDELMKGFDVDPSLMNQFQPKPAIDAKGIVLKFLGSIIPQIDVGTTSGDKSVSIKAPFVNVSLNGSQKNVRVSVPFVKVDTSSGISVKAPKLNFSLPPQGSPQSQGVSGLQSTDAAEQDSSSRTPGASQVQSSPSPGGASQVQSLSPAPSPTNNSATPELRPPIR